MTTEGASASEIGSLNGSWAPSALLVRRASSSRDAVRSRRRSSMRSISRRSCSSMTSSAPPSYVVGSLTRPTSTPLHHGVAENCQWHPSVAPRAAAGARWTGTAEVAGDHRVGVSWREGSARRPVGSSTAVSGGPGACVGPSVLASGRASAARRAGRGSSRPCGPGSEAELAGSRRARGAEELGTAVPLVLLADGARGARRAPRARAGSPRLGSCSHGTGPWPRQPERRSASSPRW